ncbi:MAG: Fic family protein [Candidatus Pacebacteria bacterium]|nr:Fic family protein [Candidatus Paceibacterota bacterium]
MVKEFISLFNDSTVVMTPEIQAMITSLEAFRDSWTLSDELVPERLTSLRKVATVESVASSTRIEGSKMSDSEVEEFFFRLTITKFVNRDEEEVAGYAAAMELVFDAWVEITITENHVKQLHRDLLKFSLKDVRHLGEYKTHENRVAAFNSDGVETGTVFETATPFDTPRLMAELHEWLRVAMEEKRHHELIIIAIYIVVFLAIHPFEDGNGRLSRILTTLLLLRAGYRFVPYGSLEAVVEQNKEEYYRALRETQVTLRSGQPNWQPWLVFILRSMQTQVGRLKLKLEREKILQLAEMPQIAIKILELARQQGRVKPSDLVTLYGYNRNTLKNHFASLVEQQMLVRFGKGPATWYILASRIRAGDTKII